MFFYTQNPQEIFLFKNVLAVFGPLHFFVTLGLNLLNYILKYLIFLLADLNNFFPLIFRKFTYDASTCDILCTYPALDLL